MRYFTKKNKSQSEYRLSDPMSNWEGNFTDLFGDAMVIRMKDNAFIVFMISEIFYYSVHKSQIQQTDLKYDRVFYELAEMCLRLMQHYFDAIYKDISMCKLEQYCHKLGRKLKIERVAFIDFTRFNSKMKSQKINNDISLFFKKESPIPRNMKFHQKPEVIMTVIPIHGEHEEFKRIESLIAQSKELCANSDVILPDPLTDTMSSIDSIEPSDDMTSHDEDIDVEISNDDL